MLGCDRNAPREHRSYRLGGILKIREGVLILIDSVLMKDNLSFFFFFGFRTSREAGLSVSCRLSIWGDKWVALRKGLAHVPLSITAKNRRANNTHLPLTQAHAHLHSHTDLSSNCPHSSKHTVTAHMPLMKECRGQTTVLYESLLKKQ